MPVAHADLFYDKTFIPLTLFTVLPPVHVRLLSGAQISKEQGGSFSVFDGAVVGTNQRLEQDRLIMQKWRFNTWPEGHYSTVSRAVLI